MSTPHTVSEYVEQAEHNTAFSQYIRDNRREWMDWSATCLFYAAVHFVNAYCRKFGIPIPRRHRGDGGGPGRTDIVQSDPQLCAIYPEYRHLDDESRDARYELKKISEADYDKFLRPKLEKISDFILPKVVN
jgi:hypothetical protein